MSRPAKALAAAVAVFLLVAFAAPPWLAHLAGERVRADAARRGFAVEWRELRVGWDGRVALDWLTVARRGRGETLFAAESVTVAIDRWALLLGRVRPLAIGVSRATGRLPGRAAAEADTLAPEPERRGRGVDPRRAERLRRAAESLVRLALTPARRMPALVLRDVTLRGPRDSETLWGGFRLDWLESRPQAGGLRLAAVGALLGERELPIEASLRHDRDDRVRGGLRVTFPDGGAGAPAEMLVILDGAIRQDRSRGRVVVHDTTHMTLGRLPLRLGAVLDRHGPSLRLELRALGVTDELLLESLPPAVVGPLAGVSTTGSWDYRLALDLDLAEPDSVRFAADVIPHGLALDPVRTRLRLLGLDQPFVAEIHLPRGRVVTRDLSPASPSFRPLEAIAPALVSAVLANEDGGFFRHRGFNLEAMRAAIAENLKAGAYRRGAGTITMQLARNLYLGHDRTLSRKFREVVLAWTLEHLTGVSKERLLEIYLNIIEWGPEVHGAAEAARYYFDRDPAALTVDECLFLATVIPSPTKWRYRLDASGGLRAFERAQMHFIGRAMVAKGWLSPDSLPAADSLGVELRGPARAILFPDSAAVADSAAAPRDSLASATGGGAEAAGDLAASGGPDEARPRARPRTRATSGARVTPGRHPPLAARSPAASAPRRPIHGPRPSWTRSSQAVRLLGGSHPPTRPQAALDPRRREVGLDRALAFRHLGFAFRDLRWKG